MKMIGVLGGLGPQATMDFEARVHLVSQQLLAPRANTGYPPMIVYYYRYTPFLMQQEHTPIFPLQPDPRLLAAAKQLGACADFLVITSSNGSGVASATVANWPCCDDHDAARTGRCTSGSCLTMGCWAFSSLSSK